MCSAPPDTRTAASARLFAEASAVIPGGVNSPVRAFTSVGGTPRFITSAQGYWLVDADRNRYVDLVCSWGPMILGHAHPAVVEAVRRVALDGLSFGAPNDSPLVAARCTASTTAGCACPRIIGPHEHTRST